MDKCVTGKESECTIYAGSLKIPHRKKSSKSKTSEKFDDSLLDEPTPYKASQSTSSTPDSSLQDMIKAMNNQLASLASQFEEFKHSEKPTASHKSLPPSQEQGMCACVPASQARPQPSEGELYDEESTLLARKRHRSRSPQGEADVHQQELDPSYVEMLNAIRGLLDLEVPYVECLVAPSAFSKKPSKQVVRKQNLALPPVQDIQSMWDYRFRKASGTTVKDKSSSESFEELNNRIQELATEIRSSEDLDTVKESADLMIKYSQLQASVTSSLEIALDTVLKQNMTLACNMLLARRDSLLKDCNSKLGPKDLASLRTGHFDQQEVFNSDILSQVEDNMIKKLSIMKESDTKSYRDSVKNFDFGRSSHPKSSQESSRSFRDKRTQPNTSYNHFSVRASQGGRGGKSK